MSLTKTARLCYLCKGEKTIPVRTAGLVTGHIGCPACKVAPGDVIGEGFVLSDPASSPGVYRLAVAVCADDCGRMLAEQYGLSYDGIQDGVHGDKAFQFTCLFTGATFYIRELVDLEDKLTEVRNRFETGGKQ